MSTKENKAVLRRCYEELINQKNLAAIDELIAENFVIHDAPPGLPRGPEGAKIAISDFHTAFPDGHLTIDEMIAEGDTVSTRMTFHGTHTGEFQGIAPTGKAVTVQGVNMIRVVNGKKVELWGGLNLFSLLQQIGGIPR
jgi:predicted ester cyclase